ncbi:hypothetical protein F4703DRAFT_1588752 [Phycomyces blakesleeanus]
MNILRAFVTWIFPDAFPQTNQKPAQDHLIQVTIDREVFRGLTISSTFNATAIKLALINKIGMIGNISGYLYYYENEFDENISQPLSDEDLVFFCNQSDNSLTNRFLVRAMEQSKPGSFSDPLSSGFRSPYSSSVNSLELGGNPRYNAHPYTVNGNRRLPPPPIFVPQPPKSRQEENSSSSEGTNHI